jgi:hypothetical protein
LATPAVTVGCAENVAAHAPLDVFWGGIAGEENAVDLV